MHGARSTEWFRVLSNAGQEEITKKWFDTAFGSFVHRSRSLPLGSFAVFFSFVLFPFLSVSLSCARKHALCPLPHPQQYAGLGFTAVETTPAAARDSGSGEEGSGFDIWYRFSGESSGVCGGAAVPASRLRHGQHVERSQQAHPQQGANGSAQSQTARWPTHLGECGDRTGGRLIS